MMLLYNDLHRYLYAIQINGHACHYVGSWPAANNVDSSSKGKWPTGVFPFLGIIEVGGEDGKLDGKFGPYFLRFGFVPGRDGMGIHAGRSMVPDGAGRKGPHHATMGCIRTWAQSLNEIVQMHRTRAPIEYLVVTDTVDLQEA